MDFEKLLKFVEEESKRSKKYRGEYSDKEKEVFAFAVKLMEEVGELSQEILFHSSLQRKHKVRKFKKDNLSDEFADVLLVTLLLAKRMGVDVKKALDNKTKKIVKRYEK